MSRSNELSFGKPFENGTISRNANSTCTPGNATRSSLRSSISSLLCRSSSLSGTCGLFQPRLPRKTTDLLDRAEDALDDARPRHDDTARPVRKISRALPLAVFRVNVQHRLP